MTTATPADLTSIETTLAAIQMTLAGMRTDATANLATIPTAIDSIATAVNAVNTTLAMETTVPLYQAHDFSWWDALVTDLETNSALDPGTGQLVQ